MATPNFDDLSEALNLCRDSECAGNPESCDSCQGIAVALAVYRGREERAKRKAAKAEAELEKGRAFVERIQQVAMDRGGFDQGVEVDSATFLVQALEAAEVERDRLCAEAERLGNAVGEEARRADQVGSDALAGWNKEANALRDERDRLVAALERVRSRDCICGGDGHPPTMCGHCIAVAVLDARCARKDQGHE